MMYSKLWVIISKFITTLFDIFIAFLISSSQATEVITYYINSAAVRKKSFPRLML